MKNILKLSILVTTFITVGFSNVKEVYIFSGDAAISLSPNKASKRVDLINKTYATNDENSIKKRSHK